MGKSDARRSTTRRRFLQTAAIGAGAGVGAGFLLAGRSAEAAAETGTSQQVFFDDFDSIDTIDVNATGEPGYNWYPMKWFSDEATSPENISVSDSVLTLGGAGGDNGWTSLVSAFAIPTSPYYRGTVFGQGGYFEARIAFDHAQQGPDPQAAPAFWSMAIEHVYDQLNANDEQWPGQEQGYAHYAELDFMEHFREPGREDYVCSIHDWSGKFEPFWWYNIFNDNNIVNVGPVDWSEFHTYSCAWTPQDGDTPGHVQWFFDGLAGPTTNIYWKGPIGDPPLAGQPPEPGDPAVGYFSPDTPEEADRTYAIMDQQRHAIQISTDPGWPVYVDWVRVSYSTTELGG